MTFSHCLLLASDSTTLPSRGDVIREGQPPAANVSAIPEGASSATSVVAAAVSPNSPTGLSEVEPQAMGVDHILIMKHLQGITNEKGSQCLSLAPIPCAPPAKGIVIQEGQVPALRADVSAGKGKEKATEAARPPSDVDISVDIITEMIEDQVQEVLATIETLPQLEELQVPEEDLLERAGTTAPPKTLKRRELIADKVRAEELGKLINARCKNLDPRGKIAMLDLKVVLALERLCSEAHQRISTVLLGSGTSSSLPLLTALEQG